MTPKLRKNDENPLVIYEAGLSDTEVEYTPKYDLGNARI